MPAYVSLAIGMLGAISVVLLLKSFFADGGFRSLRPASLLLAVAVILPNLTTTIGMILGERHVLTDAFYNRIVQYTGLSQNANAIASPLLLALAALIFLFQLSRRRLQVNPAALWMALLLAVSALSNWNAGRSLLDGGHATLLVLVIAAVFLPRGHEAVKGAALGIGLLLCISAIGSIVQPTFAAPPCDNRKCGLLGTFYVGVSDNQNTFGLLMAYAVPVLYFGLRRYKVYFAFAATFLAFASGARTGAIAAGVTLLIVLVMHFGAARGARFGRAAAVAGTTGTMLTACVMPFIDLPPGTFSDRAGLWELAQSMVHESWLIGHGPDLWRSLVNIGIIPLAAGYATHNQAMETVFVTGALGAVIMVAVVLTAIYATRRNKGEFALLMLPVAIAAITERPWSLGAVDWSSWTLLLFLLAAPVLSSRIPEQVAKLPQDDVATKFAADQNALSLIESRKRWAKTL